MDIKKIIFLGDITGKQGRNAVKAYLNSLEKNPEFSKLFETDDATDTIDEKLVYQTIKNTLKYYHYINDNYQSERKQDAIVI